MSITAKKAVSFVIAATALVGIPVALYGGSDPEGAKIFLEDNGHRDVTITGKGGWECKGYYRTAFTSVSANGRTIRGTVCHGAFGEPTVKYSKKR